MKHFFSAAVAMLVAGTLPVAARAAIRDLGPAPGTDRVSVAVMLPYRHQSELDALVQAQGTPSSSLYHRFLSPAQFAAYFAPSAGDYARVIGSLRGSGFTVTRTYANRTLVDATATVDVAGRYFATRIDRVAQAGYGIRHMNVTPAIVPSNLRGAIAGVVGLSNVVTMRPFYRFGKRKPNASTGSPLFGPDGGYGPQVYVNNYDLPARIGFSGAGRTAGIVIDANFLPSDLAAFMQQMRIPEFLSYPIVQAVDGGPTTGLSGDSVEATLDVETIVSLAPWAQVYVYAPPDLSEKSILDSYEIAVADNLVDTLNSSFGGCESLLGNAVKLEDRVAEQGEAMGITFHAASGDAGYLGTGCISTSVNAPASLPHVLAVGGTELGINPLTGKEAYEIGWGDDFGASGGGISVVFPAPSYQAGVAGASRAGRNVPDVALNASPGTGSSFYFNGAFDGPIGGTSLASPIFGAMLVEIDQMNRSRSGFVNPAVYATFAKDGYTHGGTWYFRDEITGFNGFYEAGPGYDHVTGIGSVNGVAVGRAVKK
jgi:pseudomonalisin